MARAEILNCGLEGTAGFCQIAKGTGRCNQLVECLDTNGDKDLPGIYKLFPTMTIDQAVKLRKKRQGQFPEAKRPFEAFFLSIENIPDAKDYREAFARKAAKDIMPETAPINLSFIKERETQKSDTC